MFDFLRNRVSKLKEKHIHYKYICMQFTFMEYFEVNNYLCTYIYTYIRIIAYLRGIQGY